MDRNSLVFEFVSRLDEELRYEFEERAGIMEFDGGMERKLAECMALFDVYSRHPLSVLGLSLLRDDSGQYVLTKDTSLLGPLGIRSMGPAELGDVLNDSGGLVLLVPPKK